MYQQFFSFDNFSVPDKYLYYEAPGLPIYFSYCMPSCMILNPLHVLY